MIKPASGMCNLNCRYCFYHDIVEKREQRSYGFMEEKTLEAVVRKGLAAATQECTIAFQGGEPTLIGLEFYRSVVALQKKYNVNRVRIHNAIQTNGLALNAEWADFLRENRFLVGISLDGVKDTHDVNRLDAHGAGTFNRVMQAVQLLESRGVEYNILTVVNRQTAAHAGQIYSFYKRNRLRYLQFIPCLDPIGDAPGGQPYSLTPADYGDPYLRKNIEDNGWMLMPPIPFSFNTVDMEMNEPTPSAPSRRHWLGTDDEGRDILARILYGLRLSMAFAFLLTFFSSLIGVAAGAVQGYFGGRLDILMQRFIEIWESLPQLFILIIVSSIFLPSFWTLLAILLFFSWTSLTGMVRAEFMRTRNFEFVKAARVLGVGNLRIIYRHILPNALVSAVTFIPFILSEAVVALTALDFLGLGLSHEYPSLGDLVRQGKDNLQAPWIGISIFVVLSVLLTLLIFVGEGVRDALDTRKNRR